MKIIDLLNRIANKENLPKRIKYKGIVYGLKGTLYINDDETDRLMDFLYADFRNLNDEIEIIEDEEIDIQEIEEITETSTIDYSKNTKEMISAYQLIHRCEYKINEIIRVINKMQKARLN